MVGDYLQRAYACLTSVIILGTVPKSSPEMLASKLFVPKSQDLSSVHYSFIRRKKVDVVVLDLKGELVESEIKRFLLALKRDKIPVVSIDALREYSVFLSFLWIPSFFLSDDEISKIDKEKVYFGWDSYLIEKRLGETTLSRDKRVLILSGGADTARLGRDLPQRISEVIREPLVVDWVQGPFAQAPNIPKSDHHLWNIHFAPNGLDHLINQASHVICVFGVSFFEALLFGKPTIVFSPYGSKDSRELAELKEQGVALVSDKEKVVADLLTLINDEELSRSLASVATSKMSDKGPALLAEIIFNL